MDGNLEELRMRKESLMAQKAEVETVHRQALREGGARTLSRLEVFGREVVKSTEGLYALREGGMLSRRFFIDPANTALIDEKVRDDVRGVRFVRRRHLERLRRQHYSELMESDRRTKDSLLKTLDEGEQKLRKDLFAKGSDCFESGSCFAAIGEMDSEIPEDSKQVFIDPEALMSKKKEKDEGGEAVLGLFSLFDELRKTDAAKFGVEEAKEKIAAFQEFGVETMAVGASAIESDIVRKAPSAAYVFLLQAVSNALVAKINKLGSRQDENIEAEAYAGLYRYASKMNVIANCLLASLSLHERLKDDDEKERESREAENYADKQRRLDEQIDDVERSIERCEQVRRENNLKALRLAVRQLNPEDAYLASLLKTDGMREALVEKLSIRLGDRMITEDFFDMKTYKTLLGEIASRMEVKQSLADEAAGVLRSDDEMVMYANRLRTVLERCRKSSVLGDVAGQLADSEELRQRIIGGETGDALLIWMEENYEANLAAFEEFLQRSGFSDSEEISKKLTAAFCETCADTMCLKSATKTVSRAKSFIRNLKISHRALYDDIRLTKAYKMLDTSADIGEGVRKLKSTELLRAGGCGTELYLPYAERIGEAIMEKVHEGAFASLGYKAKTDEQINKLAHPQFAALVSEIKENLIRSMPAFGRINGYSFERIRAAVAPFAVLGDPGLVSREASKEEEKLSAEEEFKEIRREVEYYGENYAPKRAVYSLADRKKSRTFKSLFVDDEARADRRTERFSTSRDIKTRCMRSSVAGVNVWITYLEDLSLGKKTEDEIREGLAGSLVEAEQERQKKADDVKTKKEKISNLEKDIKNCSFELPMGEEEVLLAAKDRHYSDIQEERNDVYKERLSADRQLSVRRQLIFYRRIMKFVSQKKYTKLPLFMRRLYANLQKTMMDASITDEQFAAELEKAIAAAEGKTASPEALKVIERQTARIAELSRLGGKTFEKFVPYLMSDDRFYNTVSIYDDGAFLELVGKMKTRVLHASRFMDRYCAALPADVVDEILVNHFREYEENEYSDAELEEKVRSDYSEICNARLGSKKSLAEVMTDLQKGDVSKKGRETLQWQEFVKKNHDLIIARAETLQELTDSKKLRSLAEGTKELYDRNVPLRDEVFERLVAKKAKERAEALYSPGQGEVTEEELKANREALRVSFELFTKHLMITDTSGKGVKEAFVAKLEEAAGRLLEEDRETVSDTIRAKDFFEEKRAVWLLAEERKQKGREIADKNHRRREEAIAFLKDEKQLKKKPDAGEEKRKIAVLEAKTLSYPLLHLEAVDAIREMTAAMYSLSPEEYKKRYEELTGYFERAIAAEGVFEKLSDEVFAKETEEAGQSEEQRELDRKRLLAGLKDIWYAQLFTGKFDDGEEFSEEKLALRVREDLESSDFRRYIMDSRSLLEGMGSDSLTESEVTSYAVFDRDRFMSTIARELGKKKPAEEIKKFNTDDIRLFAVALGFPKLLGKEKTDKTATGQADPVKAVMLDDALSRIKMTKLGKAIASFVDGGELSVSADYSLAMMNLRKLRKAGGTEIDTDLAKMAVDFVEGIRKLRDAAVEPDLQFLGGSPEEMLGRQRITLGEKEQAVSGLKDFSDYVRGIDKDIDPDEENMRLLVLVLQDRTILDYSTQDGWWTTRKDGGTFKRVNEDGRAKMLAAAGSGYLSKLVGDLGEEAAVRAALAQLLTCQVRDDVDSQHFSLEGSVVKRKERIDKALLKEAAKFAKELLAEAKRFDVVRASVTPEYIRKSAIAPATRELDRMEAEKKAGTFELSEASFERFLKQQAEIDGEPAIFAGYLALSDNEKELFIRAIARRDVLDISKKNIMANRLGQAERDYVNPAARAVLVDEFVETGSMSGLTEADFEKAFYGAISCQYDDSRDYDKEEVDGAATHQAFLLNRERRTAVDWKLIQRGVQFVTRARSERTMAEGQKLLASFAGDEEGEFEVGTDFLRKNLHSAGNRLTRFAARFAAEELFDMVPDTAKLLVRTLLPREATNAVNSLGVFGGDEEEEEGKPGLVEKALGRFDEGADIVDQINTYANEDQISSAIVESVGKKVGAVASAASEVKKISDKAGMISDIKDIVAAVCHEAMLVDSAIKSKKLEASDEERKKQLESRLDASNAQMTALFMQAWDKLKAQVGQGSGFAADRGVDEIIAGTAGLLGDVAESAFGDAADVIMDTAVAFINFVRSAIHEEVVIRNSFDIPEAVRKQKELLLSVGFSEKAIESDGDGQTFFTKSQGFQGMTELGTFLGRNIAHSLLFAASRFNTKQLGVRVLATTTLKVLGCEDALNDTSAKAAETVFGKMMGDYRG